MTTQEIAGIAFRIFLALLYGDRLLNMANALKPFLRSGVKAEERAQPSEDPVQNAGEKSLPAVIALSAAELSSTWFLAFLLLSF